MRPFFKYTKRILAFVMAATMALSSPLQALAEEIVPINEVPEVMDIISGDEIAVAEDAIEAAEAVEADKEEDDQDFAEETPDDMPVLTTAEDTQGTVGFYWGISDGTLYIRNSADDICTASFDGASAPWVAQEYTAVVIGTEAEEVCPTNLADWFKDSGCITADLTYLNTSRVTDMSGMFEGSTALKSVRFGRGLDTENVEDLSRMFMDCSAMETIYSYVNFNTEKVEDDTDMFAGCLSLIGGYSCRYAADKVGSEYARIDGMFIKTAGYFTKLTDNKIFWGINDEGLLKLSSKILSGEYEQSGCFFEDGICEWDGFYWGEYSEQIKSVIVGGEDDIVVFPESFAFRDLKNAETIVFSGVDTSEMLEMTDMFFGCSSLTELDLSSFDTSNVVLMSRMFYGCESLETLRLGDFHTEKVTTMDSMFEKCRKLSGIELGSFNTTNVTEMSYMFASCASLQELDLSNFDTSKVKDMSYLFSGCSGLSSLDLSNFDTALVTNMSFMFEGCSSLEELDVSNFNTSNVESRGSYEGMYGMFEGCQKLTSLDVSSFTTQKVTDLSYMFSGCKALETLNLANFDTSNVEKMNGIFYNCEQLRTVYVKNSFVLEKCTTDEIFIYTENLTGGNGSRWPISVMDEVVEDGKFVSRYYDPEITSSYSIKLARIDTPEAPGYFTCTDTVIYKSNDGRDSTRTQSYDGLETITVLKNTFYHVDQTFTGWNTKEDGTGTMYQPGDTVSVAELEADENGIKSLYAVWAQKYYTVTWKNDNGEVLRTDENVLYGTVPEYQGEEPKKAQKGKYAYIFTGWDKELKAVTENAEYTAEYSRYILKYTVVWKNIDGTVLETDEDVVYGTEPSFDGGEPKRKEDVFASYTFKGWEPAIKPVECDIEYTAVYEEHKELRYNLSGESVKLSGILSGENVGLTGDVESVSNNDSEYFEVTEDESGNDWTVTAKKLMVEPQILTVTISGKAYDIYLTGGMQNVIVADSVEDLQSEHPYANNTDTTWVYRVEGAAKLKIKFSDSTETESGSDFIAIRNKNNSLVAEYSGTQAKSKEVIVDYDTVKVQLKSDKVITKYGFAVESVYAMDSICVTSLPKKSVYLPGFDPDYSGLVISGVYEDGTKETIPSSAYTLSPVDKEQAGKQMVQVTYRGLQTEFEIEYSEAQLVSLSFLSLPNKRTYYYQEQPDYSGLRVSVKDAMGRSFEVEKGYEITGFDSEKAGSQEITVTYKTVSATFNITVKFGFNYTISSSGATITGVSESSVTSLHIPSKIEGKNVIAIKANAFSSCSSITSITLPETLQTIGEYAFKGTGITTVTVPESVTSIGYGAFYGCSKLTSITLPFIGKTRTATSGSIGDKFAYIFSSSSYTSDSDRSVSASSVPSTLSSVEITADTGVGYQAFYDCNNIRSIRLNEGITSIGSNAFNGCSNLRSIEMPEGITSIEFSAFYSCSYLGSIEIPSTVTTIGSSAFYGCRNLTSVNIPSGVTSIPSDCFYNCSSLTKIRLPESVTSIGSDAFYGCTSLATVELSTKLRSIGNYAFSSCSSITSITLPETLQTIGEYAFKGTGITTVTVPESVTSIGYGAFYGCSKLTSITLPFIGKTRTATSGSIGDKFAYIFSSSSYTSDSDRSVSASSVPSTLSSVEITDDTAVGTSAFSGCTNIRNIKLNEGITSIGSNAFNGCSNLRSIEIPESVNQIYDNAFTGVYSSIEVQANRGSYGYNYALTKGFKTKSIQSVSFDQKAVTLYKGDTYTPVVTMIDLKGSNVSSDNYTLTSSNTSVIRISGKTVTVYGPGKATLTVKDESCTATCSVTVRYLIEKIRLQSDTMELLTGEAQNISLTFVPANTTEAANITWESSDEDVVTVDQSGKVTAIEKGTAAITVKSAEGVTASAAVTVKAPLTGVVIRKVADPGYTGQFVFPDLKATYKGNPLTEGTDYAVSAADGFEDVNVGPAKIKITGKGLFDGITYLEYQILPNDLSGYRVTYELNGGTNDEENPALYTGTDDDIVLKDAVKTGYTFTGWFTDENLTEKISVIDCSERVELTLYAGWRINDYSIRYDYAGGSTDEENITSYTVEDDSFTLINPHRTGYTFAGWSGTGLAGTDNLTVTVQKGSTGDRSYAANWVINKYTVIWKNHNGIILEKDENVPYGTMPEYNGETPVREKDAQYTYTFKGWDMVPATVEEDITYTAEYSTTLNKYTVTWKNYDGTVLEVDENVPYGTMPEYNGEAPVKAPDYDNTYRFDSKWNKEITAVKENVDYQAVFTTVPKLVYNTYALRSVNLSNILYEVGLSGTVLNVYSEDSDFLSVARTEEPLDDWRIAVRQYMKNRHELKVELHANCGEYSDIGKAYKKIIIDSNCSGYLTYDIDEDGVDELFISTGDGALQYVAAYDWNGTTAQKTSWSGPGDGYCHHVIGKDGKLYAKHYTIGMPTRYFNRIVYRNGEITINEEKITEEDVNVREFHRDDEEGLIPYRTGEWEEKDETYTIYMISKLDFGKEIIIAASPADIHTEHQYANNMDKVWIYTVPGAVDLKVKFNSSFETESNYDYLYIYDRDGYQLGKYCGTSLRNSTISVNGDAVIFRFTSDGSQVKYGFAVDSIVALTSLSLEGLSDRLVYRTGYAPDLSTFKVYACYDNGVKERVTDYQMTEIDPNQEGVQHITVSWGKLEASFDIEFRSDVEMTGIRVEKLPDKVTYYPGEIPDYSGISVVKADAYGHEFSVPVEECSFSEVDTTEIGTYPVTVSYGAFSTAFDIKVRRIYDYSVGNSGVTITGLSKKSAESVEIPEEIDGKKVIAIGNNAFSGCSSLKSISLPDSVETIGNNAFYNCFGLTEMAMPGALTSIGSYAFTGTGISSLELPETVNSIGEGAFSNCAKLTGVNIPQAVKSISKKLFFGCSLLQSIGLHEEITQIGESAFEGSGLTAVVIPEGVTSIPTGAFLGCSKLAQVTLSEKTVSIGNYAFSQTAISGIELPDTVKSINEGAFKDCISLRIINLPSKMTSLGAYAFRNTGLTSAVVPDMVTSIGQGVFAGTGMTELTVPFVGAYINETGWNGTLLYMFATQSSTTSYSSYSKISDGLGSNSGCVYYNAGSRNGYYNEVPVSLKKVTVTKDTDIAAQAFAKQENLKEVSLSSTATSLIIGEAAFYGCRSLTGIGETAQIRSMGASAFEKSGLTSLRLSYDISTLPARVFAECMLLKSVEVPVNVVSIGESAFSGSGIEGIKLPYNTTSIGASAFANCRQLTSVELSSGITEISDSLFADCSGLTAILLPQTLETIGTDAFRNSGLITIEIPKSVTSIGRGALAGTRVESISIPFIGSSRIASGWNDTLGYIFATVNSSVQIAKSSTSYVSAKDVLKAYGNYTYYDYRSSSSPYYYYGYANEVPSSLKSVEVTDDTDVGAQAFANQKNLTEVKLDPQTTGINACAFFGCTRLTKLELPEKLTEVKEYALADTGISEMTIPVTVTGIQNNSCEGITNVNRVVSLDPTGGKMASATATIKVGSDGSQLPVPTIEDATKEFSGWFTAVNGGTAVCSATPYTLSTGKLYAHWGPKTIKVSLDANGGSVSPTSVTVKYNSYYTGLPTPTYSGKTFFGWYTEKDGGREVNSATLVEATEDITLYAQWDGLYWAVSGSTLIISEGVVSGSYSGKFSKNAAADIAVPWAKYSISQVRFAGIVKPKNMSRWFMNLGSCTFDLTGLDTSEVTDMDHLFSDCSFGNLDLSQMDTSNVVDMSSMFENAAGSINFGKINTENVTNMNAMFRNFMQTFALTTLLDLRRFSTKNVTDMASMFEGSNIEQINLLNFDTAKVENMNHMFSGCSQLKSVVYDDSTGFTTETAEDMSFMFNGCGSLTSIDWVDLSIDSATNTEHMFYGCRSLSARISLDHVNAGKRITSMESMFDGCAGGMNIELSGMSFDSLKTARRMFAGVGGTVILKNISMPLVTDMSEMFCQSSIDKIDLSTVKVKKLTDMHQMFDGCGASKIILSGLNTAQVTDMSKLFCDCENLTGVELKKLNTTKVTTMRSMFDSCEKIRLLDLRSFNTSNVTDMYRMFYYCRALVTIGAGEQFVTGKVTQDVQMFQHCNKLVGQNGTAYNEDKQDKEFARLDTPKIPGYFSSMEANI